MHPGRCYRHNRVRRKHMNRFSKLSHIIWFPKYRDRVLEGKIDYGIGKSIRIHSERLDCELVELNIQLDYILIRVLPKVSISKLIGTLKGKSGLQLSRRFPYLKEKPYWGKHFWAKCYCVDTVGVDAEMIRQYVKYQEKLERSLKLDL